MSRSFGTVRLTSKVWNEVVDCLLGANLGDDSLESVDSVDLEVDLLGFHLLLEELEGVQCFDHIVFCFC